MGISRRADATPGQWRKAVAKVRRKMKKLRDEGERGKPWGDLRFLDYFYKRGDRSESLFTKMEEV